MNNYYILTYLVPEINENLQGAVFVQAITTARNTLEIVWESATHHRLFLDLSPSMPTIFSDNGASHTPKHKLTFFNELEGKSLKSIRLAAFDRVISLDFSELYCLQVTLFGSNPNVILLQRGHPVDRFKQSQEAPFVPGNTPKFFDVTRLKGNNFRKNILALNPLLPRDQIAETLSAFKQKGITDVLTVAKALTLECEQCREARLLDDGRITLFTSTTLPVPSVQSGFPVNELIAHSYFRMRSAAWLAKQKKQWLTRLDRAISSAEKLVLDEQEVKKIRDRAERDRKKADSLMAIKPEMNKGQAPLILTIQNLYEEDPFSISLESGQQSFELAEKWYRKARSTEQRIQNLEEESKRAQARKIELEAIKQELTELRRLRDSKPIQKKIEQMGLLTAAQENESSSFREFDISGWTLFVGRNSSNNDELLKYAHKEDVWFHARGVGGSHGILRTNRLKQYPPKEIVEKAAAVVAFYSKLKNSAWVPVQFTKRKFIRKPKGATPGMVLVDREEVILVQPKRG